MLFFVSILIIIATLYRSCTVDILHPTNGTSSSLTLSFYLTDASDLHYVVADSHRHANLTALEISALTKMHKSSDDCVKSGIIRTERDRYVDQRIDNLEPDTAYSVHLMAEVPYSKGIFGPVIRTEARTHAAPPQIQSFFANAIKNSTTEALLTIITDRPGRVYILAVPKNFNRAPNISIDAITAPDSSLNAVSHQLEAGSINSTTVLKQLEPAKSYDAYVALKSLGSGHVFGPIIVYPDAFRTHAPAADVISLSCNALNASHNYIVLWLQIQHSAVHIDYLTDEEAKWRSFNVHHEVVKQNQEIPLSEDRESTGSTSFSFSSTLELKSELNRAHSIIVPVRSNGEYAIRLVAETIADSGVYGKPQAVRGCRAHDAAPSVKQLSISPTHASTESLDLQMELERPGTIHYLIAEDGDCVYLSPLFMSISTLESFYRQACGKNQHVIRGLIEYNSHWESNSTYWRSFSIDSLLQGTIYHVVLFTETINSFGVIMPFFNHIRAATNEDAGRVFVSSIRPAVGRIDTLHILLEVEKPQNLLIICAHPEDQLLLRRCIQHHNHTKTTPLNISIENLEENTAYKVTFEAHRRDGSGVWNFATSPFRASTYASAPGFEVTAQPKYGFTDTITFRVDVEVHGVVHYALLLQSTNASSLLSSHELSGYDEKFQRTEGPIKERGTVRAEEDFLKLEIGDLEANTTYTLLVMSETLSNDFHQPSLVFSDIASTQVLTHAHAPDIAQAIIRPVDARFDTIILTINLTTAGNVHYFVSNYDFADPNMIKPRTSEASKEHQVSGQVEVTATDIIHDSNESRAMYTKEIAIGTLLSATTYRLSITTQSSNDSGVFGEFPPPILITTHPLAPELLPTANYIKSVPGSSSTLEIEIYLQKIANVHYIIFLREIGVTSAFSVERNDSRLLISTFETSQLTPKILKEASEKKVGPEVWANGSISITTEDVYRHKPTVKLIENLLPDAIFEVCLTSESVDSNGIFFWKGHQHGCVTFHTFADYSNFSRLHDDAHVRPTMSDDSSIDIELHIATTSDSIGDCLEYEDLCKIMSRANRVPYFILADGKHAMREFDLNNFSPHSSHFKSVSTSLRDAVPGARHVVHTGILKHIKSENKTHLTVMARLGDLKPNHVYYFFYAYESVGSEGVFTAVNPHLESSLQSTAIEITTHESAPRIDRYEARAKAATTDTIGLTMDLSCQTCKAATTHLFVAPSSCKLFHVADFHSYILRMRSGSKQVALSYRESCTGSLDPIILEIPVSEQEHKVRDFEYDVQGLEQNTSYTFHLITETVSSHGILSPVLKKLQVSTSARAPTFFGLQAEPRKGSTTELILRWKLTARGQVHYIVGPSHHPDLNVTSPYNISGKRSQWSDEHRPNYPYDAIKARKSVHINALDKIHHEVVSDLTAGTNYTIYLVTESSSSDGLYGEIVTLKDIKTWNSAPKLLSHSVYPTRSQTTSLSIGFRVIDPCFVHVAVVQTEPDPVMHHVARNSTVYGNRVALSEKLIARHTISNERLVQSGRWHELNVSVPTNNVTYDVYIVSETKHSDGVFGNVAVHRNVHCHPNPSRIMDVNATATAARSDSVTAYIKLDNIGNVHYRAITRGTKRSKQVEGNATFSARLADDTCEGTIAIDNLDEGSCYRFFFRTETMDSFGVFGPWSSNAIKACTHKSPAEILDEKIHKGTAMTEISATVMDHHNGSKFANEPERCDRKEDPFSLLRFITNKSKMEEVILTIKINAIHVHTLANHTSKHSQSDVYDGWDTKSTRVISSTDDANQFGLDTQVSTLSEWAK
uniref:Uncharacterized protein AlNc14C34G3075 n=1 Tax=Albugo laibachii Nc14 TaxID=890382 RepID=F0W8E5_9STRA|nr:conserved hypothetical protein [Albugo laibachii Nc14]|eukprot:CCA17400.1 conserved hypothetical protein [Albugo laibachii Nc14]